jgi:hypothetical protein
LHGWHIAREREPMPIDNENIRLSKMFVDRPTVTDVNLRIKNEPAPSHLNFESLYWLLKHAELLCEWREKHLIRFVDELDAKDAEIERLKIKVRTCNYCGEVYETEDFGCYCQCDD